jgi:hypothetical protein
MVFKVLDVNFSCVQIREKSTCSTGSLQAWWMYSWSIDSTSLGRDRSSSHIVAGHVHVNLLCYNHYKCSEAFDLEIL